MIDYLQTPLLQSLPAGSSLGTMVLLIPLLPLLAFLVLGIIRHKAITGFAAPVACLLLTVSTLLSFYVAYQYFFVVGRADGVYPQLVLMEFSWLQFTETLSFNMGILLDPISVMMLVVVSFISLMVHIYSTSYLKGEKRLPAYFAFLGLFTFSMLGLVLSSNIFQLYFFWELVGVSSFLLIGYYYDRPAAVAACKKAFIVTRFADLGLLIGILVLSYYSNTLDFITLIERFANNSSAELQSATAASFIGVSALTWGLVLVFIGGAGKSALFPLHIWLPDAMEGPTPVSALIHAATMVVAGVFLVARLFPLFLMSPATLQLITAIGLVSALFAAVIACTQTDIKRVLAYSTMSQIGFMVFALGVSGGDSVDNSGFTAAMFHLFTHAMFKALLFLGAGAVIHFVHSNEMKKMGGLRKQMPVTHAVFLIACLAIAGVPPFAGFFSKEAILAAAFENNKAVYYAALFTSGLTAFYMFRLYFRIFWNKPHVPVGHHHQHEGGVAMMLPLILLAIATVLVGFIPFGHFVSANRALLEIEFHLGFSIAPVTIGLTGIIAAYLLYQKENNKPAALAASLGVFYKAAYRKFYIDEAYLFVTHKLFFNLIGKPAAWIDRNLVDGLVNATGNGAKGLSEQIKGFQSGKIQQYAVYFLGAVIGLAFLFIYLWK